MPARALHLIPKLPPVGLRPAAEPPPPEHGASYDSGEIFSLQTSLTHAPEDPVICPRCGTTVQHGPGEQHETTHTTTWAIECHKCGGHAVVRASLSKGPRAPVFTTLVASKGQGHRVRRTAPGFATSTVVHIVFIALAAHYTLGSGVPTTEALADTTMVYLTQEAEADTEPEPEPEDTPPQTLVVQLDQVAKGFQTMQAPIEIPTSIPPIDLSQRFDPRDYSGVGVEGGIFAGVEGSDVLLTTENVVSQVFKEAAVDEPPERISGPPLRYPRMLRQAGISGEVVLEFIVGTDGRAEAESMRVISSTHAAFEAEAQDLILRSTFRPGRVRGVEVRVLVMQRIVFDIITG